MQNVFSIKEVADITGKSSATIYRYIKNKKLAVHKTSENGKSSLYIKKEDLEDFLGKKLKKEDLNSSEQNNKTSKSYVNDITVKELTLPLFEKLLEKTFIASGKELINNFDSENLYELKILKKENLTLKEKIEILVKENKKLKTSSPSLPEETKNIKENITGFKDEIRNLKKENKELLCRLEGHQKLKEENEKLWEKIEIKARENRELKDKLSQLPASPDSLRDILLNNAENMYTLSKEKELLEDKLKIYERELKELEDKFRGKSGKFEDSWWKKFFSA